MQSGTKNKNNSFVLTVNNNIEKCFQIIMKYRYLHGKNAFFSI